MAQTAKITGKQWDHGFIETIQYPFGSGQARFLYNEFSNWACPGMEREK